MTRARVAAGLSMAVSPPLTADVSYKGFITLPLNTGDLNCEPCTITRGELVGLVFGGLYRFLHYTCEWWPSCQVCLSPATRERKHLNLPDQNF